MHYLPCGLQPCGEYLFDFRALNVSINGQTLLDWYVHSWALNANSANGSNPYVDGTFFDGTQRVCVARDASVHLVRVGISLSASPFAHDGNRGVPCLRT